MDYLIAPSVPLVFWQPDVLTYGGMCCETSANGRDISRPYKLPFAPLCLCALALRFYLFLHPYHDPCTPPRTTPPARIPRPLYGSTVGWRSRLAVCRQRLRRRIG